MFLFNLQNLMSTQVIHMNMAGSVDNGGELDGAKYIYKNYK